MLVLRRREGEDVVIRTPSGEVIVVHLVEVRAGNARLGFTAASREIQIDRVELLTEQQRRDLPT